MATSDVLVTGGTGYVGGVLVRQLCARGESVRVLLRPWSPRQALAGLTFEEFTGDVSDTGSLDQAMKGVSRVYHLAAAVRMDPFAEDKLKRVNVEGSAAVAKAARAAGVKRMVHFSSVAAIGRGSLAAPADETHVFDAGDLGPYFRTKHAAEEAVQAEVGRGLDAVIVNPANVVGAAGTAGGMEPLLRMAASGRVPFYPPGAASFVPVEDVARGAILAMEKGKTGERYILGGESLSDRQLLTMAALAAGVRPPRWELPRAPVLAAARLGDLLGRAFPKAFAQFNSTVLRLPFLEFCSSSAKAERELGWRCGPVKDAIAAEIAAFRARDATPQRAI
jgi:dihydroflavonol-4-reductase